jgi:hypothetical protein
MMSAVIMSAYIVVAVTFSYWVLYTKSGKKIFK